MCKKDEDHSMYVAMQASLIRKHHQNHIYQFQLLQNLPVEFLLWTTSANDPDRLLFIDHQVYIYTFRLEEQTFNVKYMGISARFNR